MGFVAAASCFVDLAVKESDNNVKLIVLDRIEMLRQRHEHVMDSLVMDILRILTRYARKYTIYYFDRKLKVPKP